MYGAAVMLVDDLSEAFRRADLLLNPEELDAEEESEHREWLGQRLKLEQGLPTATGSGKSGLRHKFHSVVHSHKLLNRF